MKLTVFIVNIVLLTVNLILQTVKAFSEGFSVLYWITLPICLAAIVLGIICIVRDIRHEKNYEEKHSRKE